MKIRAHRCEPHHQIIGKGRRCLKKVGAPKPGVGVQFQSATRHSPFRQFAWFAPPIKPHLVLACSYLHLHPLTTFLACTFGPLSILIRPGCTTWNGSDEYEVQQGLNSLRFCHGCSGWSYGNFARLERDVTPLLDCYFFSRLSSDTQFSKSGLGTSNNEWLNKTKWFSRPKVKLTNKTLLPRTPFLTLAKQPVSRILNSGAWHTPSLHLVTIEHLQFSAEFLYVCRRHLAYCNCFP